jgi:hypothetical protein
MGLFDSIGALGSKFGNWVEQVDPLGHAIANRIMYTDSKVTRELGRGIKNTFGENTVLGHAGGVLQSEAQKNVDDPDAGIMKAAVVAAAVFGGGAAAGGSGSGAGAGAAGTDAYMAGAAEYGAGTGGAAGGAGAVAGDTYMGGAADAGAGGGGSAGAGGAAGGAKSGSTATSGSGTTSTTGTMAKDVGKAVATQTLLQAMQPKAPKAGGPQAMPDPQATAEARKRKLIEQSSRRGRMSTILTSNRGDLG